MASSIGPSLGWGRPVRAGETLVLEYEDGIAIHARVNVLDVDCRHADALA